VTRKTEDATERDRRRYQRELFDGLARLHEAPVHRTFSQRPSGQAEVGLTLEAKVTMARVGRPASGG
jgi:aminoglycoside phosphotransferase (APT) family kinase protein